MTVSKIPVNKHDIVSNIPLSVDVYQVSLASVNFWKFLRLTTQPKPWVTQPIDNSDSNVLPTRSLSNLCTSI